MRRRGRSPRDAAERTTDLLDAWHRTGKKSCERRSRSGRDPPPRQRLRLLAAEDNKTNQLVFRTMLKALDLDLTLVGDGAALVEAYKDAPPDMVFTDISMPGWTGPRRRSRSAPHEKEAGLAPVPIIAMTAHALTGDKERLLETGWTTS
jgi:CheY-like chemotaxis protein